MASLDIQLSHNKRSTGLLVPFGLKDGKMYEPRQVLNGKPCGCICPSCKSPLVAKNNLKNQKILHFAHAPGENCIHGRESAVHLAAKQLIEEHRKLYIPDHIVRVCVVDEMEVEHSPQKTLIPAGLIDFSRVRLEQNVSDFRPDLVATTVNGNDLLVEIAVTSFVNNIKQKKIESNGTAAIEIDASKISDFNFDVLAKLLFEPSPHTKWIFHPKDESIKLALRERLTPILEAAKIEAQKHAEKFRKEAEKRNRDKALEVQRQAILKEQNRRKIAEFKAMSVDEKLAFSLGCLKMDESIIPDFLDYKVRGESSFGVPRRVWQLSIFGAFIQQQAGFKKSAFKLDKVLEWLQPRFEITRSFANSEKVAVWDFLRNLSELCVLRSTGRQWFEIEQNNFKKIIIRQRTTPYNKAKISTRQDEPPYNIAKISLSDFYLEWEQVWPKCDQVALVAQRYKRQYGSICNWERITELLIEAKNRSPLDIAKYYSSGKDGAEDDILKFMVEAQFVRLHKLAY